MILIVIFQYLYLLFYLQQSSFSFIAVKSDCPHLRSGCVLRTGLLHSNFCKHILHINGTSLLSRAELSRQLRKQSASSALAWFII